MNSKTIIPLKVIQLQWHPILERQPLTLLSRFFLNEVSRFIFPAKYSSHNFTIPFRTQLYVARTNINFYPLLDYVKRWCAYFTGSFYEVSA